MTQNTSGHPKKTKTRRTVFQHKTILEPLEGETICAAAPVDAEFGRLEFVCNDVFGAAENDVLTTYGHLCGAGRAVSALICVGQGDGVGLVRVIDAGKEIRADRLGDDFAIVVAAIIDLEGL